MSKFGNIFFALSITFKYYICISAKRKNFVFHETVKNWNSEDKFCKVLKKLMKQDNIVYKIHENESMGGLKSAIDTIREKNKLLVEVNSRLQ